MIAVGMKVRVLAPFDTAFPEVYTVGGVTDADGGTVVTLEGVESAFDPKYLESAE